MSLYVWNEAAQDVAVGGTLALGSGMRCGTCAVQNGNGVTLNAPGWYRFEASVTGTTDAAGTFAVEARVDGVAVPGATASQTVAVAGDLAALPLAFFVRADGCRCVSRPTVTLVNVGDAGTVENLAMTVTRVA